MRWIFIILIVQWNVLSAQLIDDFSDGDFTNNPEWVGTTDKFRIEFSSGMLQLNAPAADGEGWLFTGSQATENAVWQFRIRMGFNPSSANYAQVYLAAESNGYPNTGSAFYLVLGTTADNICLWERKGGINKKLIDGQTGRLNLSTIDAQVRVTRHKGGLFILECNMGAGWIEEGRYVGSVGMKSSWFGLSCHYTSTRSTLFYFDDFHVTGEVFKDTIPPSLILLEVKNRYNIMVRFSKPVSKLNVDPDNFRLNPGAPTPEIMAVDGDQNALMLLFKQGIPVLPNGVLQISGLSDVEGNLMSDNEYPYTYYLTELTSTEVLDVRTVKLCFSRPLSQNSTSVNSFIWFGGGPGISSVSFSDQNCVILSLDNDFPSGETLQMKLNQVVSLNGDTIATGPYPLFYYKTQRNDIVITEVMADPTPVVLLPDSEYIEIYNRGEYPIQMSGYKLSVGTREATLGAYLLFPDEYLLLVPSTLATEWAFIENILVVSNWPLLPNTEGDIVLRDQTGRVIASLRYNPKMGMAGFKQDGGWSLEIRDPDNLSGSWENWSFSINDKGGTPGFRNSVAGNFPDKGSPELKGIYAKNKTCVVMEFSEPMAINIGDLTSLFEIVPHTLNIASYMCEEKFLTESEICFSEEMPDDGVFLLNFKTLPMDLAGNSLSGKPFFSFGWPIKPKMGDIVINELLYDPKSGGSDYLELYNKSDHLLDLSDIFVARANADGTPEKLVRLSPLKRFFLPKSYLVYTPDPNWLLVNYLVDDVRSVRNLPDLPNYLTPQGTVFLTDVSGQLFDHFSYHDNMHFALLASRKGVALERIDFNASTQDRSNWHSASATSGYGTPGMRNSQASTGGTQPVTDFIKVEPEVFYPNQDGHNDLLFIRYFFKDEGNSCTIIIFNRDGRPVRNLVNNQLVGKEGFFTWDGLSDNGSRCPSGIYIVWTRNFTVSGNVSEKRKIAVLGSGRP